MHRAITLILIVTALGAAGLPAIGVSALSPARGLELAPAALQAQDACPAALPIAEARKMAPETSVTLRGTVTAPTGIFTANQSFALQDATGGIYVYRAGGIGQTVALGDEVCVTGRLSSYHGLLELIPASADRVVRLGPGTPPAPRAVAPTDIGEATEGLLVTITGPVSAVSERRFRVGEATVYLQARSGPTTAGLTAGCPITVTGLSADYDGPQVWPRFSSDIVAGECRPAACPRLTIAQIQGPGRASPYDGKTNVGCVTGCVTGVAADGFYLQSTEPDTDPLTSEGIFVFRWSGWTNPRGLRAGDLVEVRNITVQEFYGSTEIVGLSGDSEAAYRRLGTCPLPAAQPIPPPTDPTADPEALYEPFEGMRVALTFDGTVVGPTTRYASRFPSGEPEVALVDRHSPLHGRRLFADELPLGRGIIYLTGGLGRDLPEVGTGDRLAAAGLRGVLGYQFDRYVLQVEEDNVPITVEDRPDVNDGEAAIGPDQFAICTFNVENLFDATDDGDGDLGDWSPTDEASFRARLAKRAAAIRDELQGCTVVGVQELEGKDAVWEALAAASGPSYAYDYYESADERDITVGLLYDRSRVALRRSDLSQACSPADYGVDYTWARGARARANPCPSGTFPLFDRPPYVADLTVRSADGNRSLDVTVIVVHFKSRRGDEAVNLPRRVAQARYTAGLLVGPNAVALGDFNAGLGSPVLAQFAGFVNLYEAHLPREDHYSYIFNGLAEAIDHVIITRELDRYYLGGGPVHINADFPDRLTPDASGRRSSDHDPVLVRFSFSPTGISEALMGAITGAMGSWIRR